MDYQRLIIRGFEYDRWANRQWINTLGQFKQLGKPQGVLEHILGAQQIWLQRIGVIITPQQEDLTLLELFDITTRTWISIIETSHLEEPITYDTMNGAEYTTSLGTIAMHVINHGSYHRGQLRSLFEAQGSGTFPETDLIYFVREFGE